MIFQNVLFWQSVVWMIVGYLVATCLHALVAVPRRIVESL